MKEVKRRSVGIVILALLTTAIVSISHGQLRQVKSELSRRELAYVIESIQQDLKVSQRAKYEGRWQDISYASCQIGSKIPSVVHFQGELSPSTIHYFPILDQGEMVALYAVYMGDGQFFGNIFLDEEYRVIRDFLAEQDNMAILITEGMWVGISDKEPQVLRWANPTVSRADAEKWLEELHQEIDFSRIKPKKIVPIAPVAKEGLDKEKLK